jgi:putative flippase GtrA
MRDFWRSDKPEINEILPRPNGGRSERLQGLRMSVGVELDAPQRVANDPVHALVARLPRPIRFLGVGGLGLITDFCVFTILMGYAPRPLLMRLFSLAAATVVTWRLNRALTFDDSGRRQHDEAMRYAAVTAAAQGTSYAVFASLVLTVLGALPQAALIAGAVAGALISYNGHRLFAFTRVSR